MITTRSVLLMLSASALMLAQDYRGRVQGVVSDASSAAVPMATVTLQNTNTQVATTRTTDESGRYLFDFVEPGTYTLTAESSGFGKFVKENIQVLVRSDITVNPSLRVGDVSQTITVSESAVEIQFNTTTLGQTIDTKMLKELPVLARNPFTLALLDPAVVNRYSDISKRNPFYQLSTTGVDVGGQTSGRNEVQIDGSPIGVGSRGSYAPPMDAVQEFTVQQNSIDAESGFSAGGVLNVGMKAGTNEYHGSLYYFGRNPKFNAVSNAFTRAPNVVRNHVGGGTFGGPIRRNRLFTFFTYEQWKNRQPYTRVMTLPTALERAGDFSRTLTKDGALRPVFDPITTQTSGNVVTRTPFPGNRIPPSRFDPTSRLFLADIWEPNNPGDDLTGVNNYRTGYAWFLNYWNFSNRTDWNITDKWKVFARYSVIRTRLDNNNYGGTVATTSDNGGLMDALNGAFDSVYTLSARSVLNFRMGVVYSEDEYDSAWAKLGEAGLARYWPGNAWYTPYTKDSPAVYYPNLNIGGATFGKGSWWSYRPRKYSYQGSMGHDRNRHYLKFGMAYRHAYEYSVLPNLGAFPFTANMTAETYNAPNLLLNGSAWATFLLGYIDNSLNAQYVSPRYTEQDQYGVFFQDDFKLNRRVTLNLGLRWEYETAPSERLRRLSRFLDLTNPIPEFQGANRPVMPPQVAAIPGAVQPTYNGAWIYTTDQNKGLYNASARNFLPRLGVAIRANDRTAVRIGYARYAVPLMSVFGYSWRLPATDGFSAISNGPPQLLGVPQGVFSNPFPASNPLVLPKGNSEGRNTNLGAAATWSAQNPKTPMNDRVNFTVERDLFMGFKGDVTFFMNFGHNMVPEGQGGNAGFGTARNMIDPQLSYTHKNNLAVPVTNPFFGLPASLMPGQLRGQRTVPLSTLLRPYPQYGDLTETFRPGVENRYKALQMRLQRRFADGYSITWGYNYNRESTGDYFNAPDQYADRLTMIPAALPRHRMTVGTTNDLPFGRGQKFGSNIHPVLNAIIGGWSTSSIFMWNSGSFLRFGQLDVTGDPGKATREWSRWFNTSVFKQATPFTPRTNPFQYDGITGPRFWQLDTTLSKNFALTERFKLELRFEGYNLTNSVMPGNPVLNVVSTQFGGITSQVNYGREVQYTLRIHF